MNKSNMNKKRIKKYMQELYQDIISRFRYQLNTNTTLFQIRKLITEKFYAMGNQLGFDASDYIILCKKQDDMMIGIRFVPKGGFTADDFEFMVGHQPIQFDLERVNCVKAGHAGHYGCGICEKHMKPNFMCDCFKET